ncbi:MAG TPA: hypothetical protein VM600_01985 [Actinomycetota bacterium]|nr:hypothetical protein [Actinomycetota bacterium]
MGRNAPLGRLIVLLIMSAATLATPSAGAEGPTQHVVQVGATHPTNPLSPFGYTRFYPDVLRVHQGDLVEWRWGAASYFGWHSVSFFADDMSVADHPTGNDAAVPLFARLDETPGSLAMNEAWIFGKPTGGKYGEAACGRGPWRALPAQAPCVLRSADQTVTSSVSDSFFNMPAIPQKLSFSVQIDVPVGAYRYRCLMHPGMDGRVEVVAPEQPVPTSEEIAAQRERDIAADTAEAEALFAALSSPSGAYNTATKEWTVKVGADTDSGHVSIYAFLPADVPARAGDRIRYVAGTKEPHTTTFTDQPVAGTFSARGPCGASQCPDGPGYGLGFTAFPFACELDAPATGAPAIFAWGPRPDDGCRVGDLEWLIAPYMADATRAPDDAVSTPATFHHSGALFNESLPMWFRGDPRAPGATFGSSFGARFPAPGRFSYYCIAHPDFMFGAVNVA